MEQINWNDFEKVELRAGTIVEVLDFPEARKLAYKLKIDFGEFGIKNSSAQITEHYQKTDLVGKQIIGVLNFGSKQIGPFVSEVLTCGFPDENENVVLAVPNRKVPNGVKLF
ncbi:MAG TPA: tRNA-binding protein [Candidatus Paceibacterota bacterium]